MIKARGGKNGTLQAGQRKARFRRAFVFSFQMSLVSRSILIGVSLSAAARSAAALVKDKLTSNCHLVDLTIDFYYLVGLFFGLYMRLVGAASVASGWRCGVSRDAS